MRSPLTVAAAALALAVVAAPTPGAQAPADADAGRRLAQAKRLLDKAPLIDGHNDIPWRMREQKPRYDFDVFDLRQPRPAPFHTDIPRLHAGGLGGQFWSVYVPGTLQGEAAVTATLEQIDAVQEMLRRYPDTFEAARTAADVERITKAGRIASMMGMEGGHAIDRSLAALIAAAVDSGSALSRVCSAFLLRKNAPPSGEVKPLTKLTITTPPFLGASIAASAQGSVTLWVSVM